MDSWSAPFRTRVRCANVGRTTRRLAGLASRVPRAASFDNQTCASPLPRAKPPPCASQLPRAKPPANQPRKQTAMYDVMSPHASDFINHEEILDTLACADRDAKDLDLVDRLIDKAREGRGLTHREADPAHLPGGA